MGGVERPVSTGCNSKGENRSRLPPQTDRKLSSKTTSFGNTSEGETKTQKVPRLDKSIREQKRFDNEEAASKKT